MFVKTRTSFQKLLDKKSLRITAFGDSKGLMFLKKFILLFRSILLLENDLIGINQAKLGLCHLFYVFLGSHILLVLL